MTKSLSATPSQSAMFLLSTAFGLSSGIVEVEVGDLLLTALVVLALAMILGGLSSTKPWRWALLLAIFIPGARIFAATVLHRVTSRAEIYESFLVLLPAVVGVYGGFLIRQVIRTLFQER